MTGIWPWDWVNSITESIQGAEHALMMAILGLLFGIAAIVILVKVGGKFRVPGFLFFMAGAALALLGVL